MCTEIDKHCEIGHKRLLMSSIETENQLSYCESTIDESKEAAKLKQNRHLEAKKSALL